MELFNDFQGVEKCLVKNEDVLNVDRALARYYCDKEDYETGLGIYKEIVKVENNEKDIKDFVDYSIKYSVNLFKAKDWTKVLEVYKGILGFSCVPKNIYKNTGLCLTSLGLHEDALKFLKKYKVMRPNEIQIYQVIGEILYSQLDNPTEAIGYYEKALSLGASDFITYSTLGHLYSKVYRDSRKEDQINCLEKAHSLEPNNEIVVKNLAYVYGKFNEIEKSDRMWEKMLTLNPSYSDLHSWGAYLVKHGRFKEGFMQLRNRFKKEDIPGIAFASILKHKDKMWKVEEPLYDKRVLVHWEQGFGDSIMFVRYLKLLQGRCRDVVAVVQEPLLGLFQSSNLSVPLITKDDIEKINFDFLIPMMDLPLLFGTTKDNIPYSEGYLNVPAEKVKRYRDKYIENNNNLKIGFAFEGSKASLDTKRDIPLTYFYKLMRMEGVDMYCCQVGDLFNQLRSVPGDCKFKQLGSTFRNWEDTACALKNMDLVITTDNGVMNLAGALGVRTLGIFNSMSEWRWFNTAGDNVGWYKSVKPYACDTTDNWDYAMRNVIEEVKTYL